VTDLVGKYLGHWNYIYQYTRDLSKCSLYNVVFIYMSIGLYLVMLKELMI